MPPREDGFPCAFAAGSVGHDWESIDTGGGTDMGDTKPAGEGISDEEMVKEVADQTSSDLAVEDVFEREADGAAGDTEAAKAGPEDLPT
jgi:hypothetical protein